MEWKYPFRIVDSDGEIILFIDPEDHNKIYIIPLAAGRHIIRLREDVILAVEKYRLEKYG